jgi:hypothetical protein
VLKGTFFITKLKMLKGWFGNEVIEVGAGEERGLKSLASTSNIMKIINFIVTNLSFYHIVPNHHISLYLKILLFGHEGK